MFFPDLLSRIFIIKETILMLLSLDTLLMYKDPLTYLKPSLVIIISTFYNIVFRLQSHI